MPAKSKEQRNLMRWALSAKEDADVYDSAPKKVQDLSKAMTKKQLKDYADTKDAEMSETTFKTFIDWLELYESGAMSEDVFIEQLLKGIAVEKEHTNNLIQRARIALDHLEEDALYYDKLESVGL
jgi:hypothetical protein